MTTDSYLSDTHEAQRATDGIDGNTHLDECVPVGVRELTSVQANAPHGSAHQQQLRWCQDSDGQERDWGRGLCCQEELAGLWNIPFAEGNEEIPAVLLSLSSLASGLAITICFGITVGGALEVGLFGGQPGYLIR
ncbi:unnamed protein product [Leuciscus chuanchicus]